MLDQEKSKRGRGRKQWVSLSFPHSMLFKVLTVLIARFFKHLEQHTVVVTEPSFSKLGSNIAVQDWPLKPNSFLLGEFSCTPLWKITPAAFVDPQIGQGRCRDPEIWESNHSIPLAPKLPHCRSQGRAGIFRPAKAGGGSSIYHLPDCGKAFILLGKDFLVWPCVVVGWRGTPTL